MIKTFTTKSFVILIACGLIGMTQKPVMADSVQEMKGIIDQQNQVIQNLQNRVSTLENQRYSAPTSAGVAATPMTLEDIAPKATWAERIKIKGDFRYRHQWENDESRDRSNTSRNRQRIRARIGIYADINECLDFGFQMATGSSDPVSTNQTLDSFFESKQLNLDLAYIDWHPDVILGMDSKGTHFIAGKMKNPFYRPLGEGLIWDGDLRPEGGAMKFKKDMGGVEVFGSVGGFWLDEMSAEADVSLWGVQAGVEIPVMEDVKVILGTSYFDYQGLLENTLYDGDSFGNSTDFNIGAGAASYLVDYDLFEAFWEVHFKMFDLPVKVGGDYVINTAGNREDVGHLHGIKVNKAKKPGDWEAKYNYRKLEPDAVFGAFTDSDFAGGGTDSEGHAFGVGYMLAKNTKLSSTLFVTRPDLSSAYSQYTWQLDLSVKF